MRSSQGAIGESDSVELRSQFDYTSEPPSLDNYANRSSFEGSGPGLATGPTSVGPAGGGGGSVDARRYEISSVPTVSSHGSNSADLSIENLLPQPEAGLDLLGEVLQDLRSFEAKESKAKGQAAPFEEGGEAAPAPFDAASMDGSVPAAPLSNMGSLPLASATSQKEPGTPHYPGSVGPKTTGDNSFSDGGTPGGYNSLVKGGGGGGGLGSCTEQPNDALFKADSGYSSGQEHKDSLGTEVVGVASGASALPPTASVPAAAVSSGASSVAAAAAAAAAPFAMSSILPPSGFSSYSPYYSASRSTASSLYSLPTSSYDANLPYSRPSPGSFDLSGYPRGISDHLRSLTAISSKYMADTAAAAAPTTPGATGANFGAPPAPAASASSSIGSSGDRPTPPVHAGAATAAAAVVSSAPTSQASFWGAAGAAAVGAGSGSTVPPLPPASRTPGSANYPAGGPTEPLSSTAWPPLSSFAPAPPPVPSDYGATLGSTYDYLSSAAAAASRNPSLNLFDPAGEESSYVRPVAFFVGGFQTPSSNFVHALCGVAFQ